MTDIVRRLREWATSNPNETYMLGIKAADRIEALTAKLREGADIVSGTWDGVYSTEDVIAWVGEAEAVLRANASATADSPKGVTND